MNANTKTALAIGALVVLASAVGAGLFVWSGSQAATWFVLVGIPLVVVSGITLYVRGVITRSGTSESQYVKQRARNVAEEFKDLLRETNDLRTNYPGWHPGVDAQIESIAGDFSTQGVDFDTESGAYDLSKKVASAEVQEFERLSAEVTDLRETIEDEFHEFAKGEFQRVDDALERLEDVDLTTDTQLPARPPNGVPTAECQDAIDALRREADDQMTTAIATVREMGRGDTRPEDLDAIERELSDAETALEDHDYEKSVEAILEARDRLREQFSGSFEAERDAVVDLVDAVNDAGIEEFVDTTYVDDVRSVEATVTDLESALDLAELTRARANLRRTCTDIIAAMERDLENHVRTLRNTDLPPGYYAEPEIVEQRHVDELEDLDDLGRFTDRWTDVADRLVTALETASTKAAVVDAYDDVAETIESELSSTGSVTGDDLPVRHAAEFLGLYYRKNQSVEFDPDGPTVYRGDVETYDLEVEVTYERGGPTRTATLELSGGGHESTETVETRIVDTATFEDVPEGEYVLEADPGDEAFTPVEREVVVGEGATASVEFTERGLRERLCGDVDADMESHLPQVRSRLESLFEEDGYVSTAMDLPVRSKQAACLLAIWAEREGLDATQADGEVVVYDREQLERELTNVLRYNVEAGDRLAYDDLERNFLTAPVPPSVIRDVVESVDTEHSVRTTETAIEME